MSKSITLKHIGYRCKGTALINFWGGGQSRVNMNSWDIDKEDRQSIVKGVNDGGFGCESIESAEVDVFDLFEQNVTQYKKITTFTKDTLKNAKRGIKDNKN